MKKFKFDQEGDTMSDWNPEKYLLFKNQRTQPALDLANRVRSCQAKTVVDIGCGPGNSTAVLKDVFPQAKILGIDNSANMISKAKAQHSGLDFRMQRRGFNRKLRSFVFQRLPAMDPQP